MALPSNGDDETIPVGIETNAVPEYTTQVVPIPFPLENDVETHRSGLDADAIAEQTVRAVPFQQSVVRLDEATYNLAMVHEHVLTTYESGLVDEADRYKLQLSVGVPDEQERAMRFGKPRVFVETYVENGDLPVDAAKPLGDDAQKMFARLDGFMQDGRRADLENLASILETRETIGRLDAAMTGGRPFESREQSAEQEHDESVAYSNHAVVTPWTPPYPVSQDQVVSDPVPWLVPPESMGAEGSFLAFARDAEGMDVLETHMGANGQVTLRVQIESHAARQRSASPDEPPSDPSPAAQARLVAWQQDLYVAATHDADVVWTDEPTAMEQLLATKQRLPRDTDDGAPLGLHETLTVVDQMYRDTNWALGSPERPDERPLFQGTALERHMGRELDDVTPSLVGIDDGSVLDQTVLRAVPLQQSVVCLDEATYNLTMVHEHVVTTYESGFSDGADRYKLQMSVGVPDEQEQGMRFGKPRVFAETRVEDGDPPPDAAKPLGDKGQQMFEQLDSLMQDGRRLDLETLSGSLEKEHKFATSGEQSLQVPNGFDQALGQEELAAYSNQAVVTAWMPPYPVSQERVAADPVPWLVPPESMGVEGSFVAFARDPEGLDVLETHMGANGQVTSRVQVDAHAALQRSASPDEPIGEPSPGAQARLVARQTELYVGATHDADVVWTDQPTSMERLLSSNQRLPYEIQGQHELDEESATPFGFRETLTVVDRMYRDTSWALGSPERPDERPLFQGTALEPHVGVELQNERTTFSRSSPSAKVEPEEPVTGFDMSL